MARKTKLTADITGKIVQAIQMGATYELASQFAGIGVSTFYNWMKQGRDRRGRDKIEFLETIKRAESRGAIANLGLIHKAAKDGDWKASAWILERRHGYSKNNTKVASSELDEQNLQEMNTKEILAQQMVQTIKASQEALQSGSYQAFAALQRQVINIALQLKNIDAESAGTEFGSQTDEELLDQISSIILALPPVLQQRLSQDIISLSNVQISATVTEN